MPEASPRSVTRSSRAPVPRSRQVSQSCGRHTAAVRAAFSGSWVASQRSLVAVNDATGTRARRVRPRLRAELGDRSVAACAERVSFHSSAGRTTSPSASRHTMPCCWPATAIASTSSRPPASRHAACSASHQAAGSTSVPGGCGARPDRTSSPVVGVADDDVAGLRRRVDPGDQAHGVTLVPSAGVGSLGRPCAWRPGTSTPPCPGCRGCCRGSTSGRPTSSACRRPSCPTRRSPRASTGRWPSAATRYAHVGEGRWNGVAMLSRVGLDDVQRALPDAPALLRHRSRPAR